MAITAKQRQATVILLIAGAALLPMRASAQDRCDAILRSGVFDTTDTLDLHTRHSVVQKITCNSTLNVDLGEPSLASSDFCSKAYEEFVKVDQYVQSVRRASQVIAGAWLECMKLKDEGLNHYFTTTADPRRFAYTIVFDDIGDAPSKSKIKSWSIKPDSVKCTGRIPGKDAKWVTEGGVNLNCVRPAFETVTVTVDATKGKAEPIDLPAVEDSYVLRVGPPDDESSCRLKREGQPEQLLVTNYFGSPEKVLYLNQHFPQRDRYYLRCEVVDRVVGGDFNPCWSGHFRVFKNGVPLFDWAPACCGAGCPGLGKTWEQSVAIDLTAESLQTRISKALNASERPKLKEEKP